MKFLKYFEDLSHKTLVNAGFGLSKLGYEDRAYNIGNKIWGDIIKLYTKKDLIKYTTGSKVDRWYPIISLRKVTLTQIRFYFDFINPEEQGYHSIGEIYCDKTHQGHYSLHLKTSGGIRINQRVKLLKFIQDIYNGVIEYPHFEKIRRNNRSKGFMIISDISAIEHMRNLMEEMGESEDVFLDFINNIDKKKLYF